MAMTGFLYFDCNYGCGEKIPVYVGDRPPLPHDDPKKRREAMYSWLGERVWMDLIDHHLEHCTEYYKQHGRPWLRLVN